MFLAATLFLTTCHVGQSLVSLYGLAVSYFSITNLQKYEEQSEKAAKYSGTAEHQLHKTRTTQASGALSVCIPFCTFYPSKAIPYRHSSRRADGNHRRATRRIPHAPLPYFHLSSDPHSIFPSENDLTTTDPLLATTILRPLNRLVLKNHNRASERRYGGYGVSSTHARQEFLDGQSQSAVCGRV